jgi:hypothetical protein
VGGVLGVEPSAPALQPLPVAGSERGAVGAVGQGGEGGPNALQNGAPFFSHTLSGCQNQAFLFLDAYGIPALREFRSPVASRGRPSSGFFLLLSLSAVVSRR